MESQVSSKVCRSHPGNFLEYFCNEEGCMKSICKKCMVSHPRHHILLNEMPAEAIQTTEFQETMDMGKDRFTGDLLWNNGTKIFKHDGKAYEYVTEATTNHLPGYFSVDIKINKLKEPGGTLIGISKLKLCKTNGYRMSL